MSASTAEAPSSVHSPGTLEVSHVTLNFGGARAIDDLSFTFDGGVLGIVGPNGAGKSSILNVLSGFIQPQVGTVRFRGRNLLKLPAYSRSRLSMGRTFQDPVHAEAMTVKENLFSGMRRSDAGSVQHDLLDLLDLERWYTREVSGLPYGVRKLLDIGRSLIRAPGLLLCDEPLSGLDETERDVMEGILAGIERRGVSLIVVEHDVARIRRLAHRILAVESGHKLAEGTPDEVLRDPAVVAAFTGVAPDEDSVATTTEED